MRGEQGRDRNIGDIAMGVHANKRAARHIVADDDSRRTSSLGPLDLIREAAAASREKGDLAGHVHTMPMIVCRCFPTGYVVATELPLCLYNDAFLRSVNVHESTADPDLATETLGGNKRAEGGGSSGEEGRVIVCQANGCGRGEERSGTAEIEKVLKRLVASIGIVWLLVAFQVGGEGQVEKGDHEEDGRQSRDEKASDGHVKRLIDERQYLKKRFGSRHMSLCKQFEITMIA